jgi:hypothetical protein
VVTLNKLGNVCKKYQFRRVRSLLFNYLGNRKTYGKSLLVHLLLLLLPFVLGPLACFPSELIWNYGSYRQLKGLLRRGISPVARPLPTQDNINTEESRTDIHASSEVRTHDPSVWANEDISCLRPSGLRSRKPRLTTVVIRCADRATPSIRKSWH